MKRNAKWVVPFMVMAVVFASVFCCCMEAKAVTTVIEHQPSCHKQAASQETPKPSNCNCHTQLSVLPVKDSLEGALALSAIKFFVVSDLVSFPVNNIDKLTRIAFSDSPPSADTPLYLKYTVLRI